MEQGTPSVGSVDELNQESEPYGALPISSVPVTIDGPVQVHQIPARSAGSRNWSGITTATRVGNEDPRRKRAVLIGISATATDYFYVGSTQNEVDSNYAVRWPVGVPLEITHQEAIYAKVTDADVILSVLNEQWAD